MPNKEKVIKGLECCAAMSGDECRKCPYEHECRDTGSSYGMSHLADNALALLNTQPDIVRCKDCKYCEYPKSEKEWCKKGHLHGNAETWFCADGERR